MDPRPICAALAALLLVGSSRAAARVDAGPPAATRPEGGDAGPDREVIQNLELLRDYELLRDLELMKPAADGGSSDDETP